ncbi:nuclear transport factor 2 family protein [Mesorhizobium sp.]|uniref:nuclear transport factor 2 family protein n=1 Tax=Mesorhizobium sp. TaxID=1871066 RepID=UPI0025C0C660|nr:nuclear transport factor 2 family protein [Mesorhizobium sp.]
MDFPSIVEIAHLMQVWGLSRDQGRWESLADCYTPDGEMHVTWYSGTVGGFIEACKKSFSKVGPRGKHVVGQPAVDLYGERAVAETSVQILARLTLSGVAVDNVSYARFIDRLVRRDGRWRIARRVAVYEKDRLDPVIPSDSFDRMMSETDFSAIPEPYRFIGFRLLQMGRKLQDNILCDGSPDAEAYRRSCQDWLLART